VLRREHAAIARRRGQARAAFLTPGPDCYVKTVDHALKGRDRLLGRFFRAADTQSAPQVPDGLAGLALSGGGVRSAAFNLGVLQRLHEIGILQKLDYLSTVSGGGYIGCSLVAYVTAAQHDAFPFARQDEAEKREAFVLRHLRRYSSYLVGRGWTDALVAALTALGGALGNLLILLPYLLVLAVLAVIQLRMVGQEASTVSATTFVGLALIAAFLYAAAQARPGAVARPWDERERFGRRIAAIGAAALAGAVWMIQPPLLHLVAETSQAMSTQGKGAAIAGGGLAASMLSVGRLAFASPLLRRPALSALLILVALGLLWVLFAALGIALLAIDCRFGAEIMVAAGLVTSAVLFAAGRFLPTNFGSLHGFYRDRLSKAFFSSRADPRRSPLSNSTTASCRTSMSIACPIRWSMHVSTSAMRRAVRKT
jgi:hypothetical protein